VPGQNAEREHLVEHGDPAGTGEIQAPGMTMRPGPGPDTETGSAGARYSSRCADPGFVWDYGYIKEYEIAQLWGTPGCSGSMAARPRS
jgi:hypothetical protein